eukprot:s1421_g13.t1
MPPKAGEVAGDRFCTAEGIVIFEGKPHKEKVLYGNLLWDGALALCRFFASEWSPAVAGKSALELGAGTGVVGLTLGHLGAAPVCITDSEKELLPLMEQNIQANSLGSCTMARRLDWGDETSYMREKPDLLVAADVLYEGVRGRIDHETKDGSLFARAVTGHLGMRSEAYVANHHNPKKCEATLGFVRAVLEQGMEVQRLEDAEGFALGCLQGRSGFRDARFVSLGRDVEAALHSPDEAHSDLPPHMAANLLTLMMTHPSCTWQFREARTKTWSRIRNAARPAGLQGQSSTASTTGSLE